MQTLWRTMNYKLLSLGLCALTVYGSQTPNGVQNIPTQVEPGVIEKLILDIHKSNQDIIEQMAKTESSALESSIKTITDLIKQFVDMNQNKQLPVYNKLDNEINTLKKLLSEKERQIDAYKKVQQANIQEKTKVEAQIKSKQAQIEQTASKENLAILEKVKQEQKKAEAELKQKVEETNKTLKKAEESAKKTQAQVKAIEQITAKSTESAKETAEIAKKEDIKTVEKITQAVANVEKK